MLTENKRAYQFGIAAFVLANLHLLRNVSPVFAVLTIAMLCAVTIVIFWRGIVIRSSANGPFVFLLACMMFAVLNSYAAVPGESYLDKIPRFFLTVPFLFVGAMISRQQLRQFLLFSAMFGALGGLSLIVQVGIGPISWFAESSERGGLVRYASILGSLTILGTFAGIAMSAAYFIKGNTYVRGATILLISIGCILSLQKAAILNMLLFMLLIAAREIKSKRYMMICMAVGVAVVLILFLNIYFSDYLDLGINTFFHTDSSVQVDDVDPIEGFVQRLWDLPSRLFEAYGWQGLLMGVGLVGGSGSLGFPDYPMAHNFVFDMLFIGGLPYLCVYAYVLISTMLRVYRLGTQRTDTDNAALFCLAFYIFNLPAATGIQFHPVISSIINLIIGFYFLSPLRLKV